MGFSDTLFSFSCLYAAVLVLYGMLSLNVDPGAARREKMSRLYGIPAAPEVRYAGYIIHTSMCMCTLRSLCHFLSHNSYLVTLFSYDFSLQNNQGSPQVRFFKSFCLRPTFLRGILMGVVVIRYHNDPIMSMSMYSTTAMHCCLTDVRVSPHCQVSS